MVYFTFLSEIWSKNQFHRVWSEVYSMDLLPLAARCCKRNSSFKIRTGDVRPHRGGKKYQKKTGSRVRPTGNVTGRGSSSSTTLPIHCQAAIRRCSSATRRHRSPMPGSGGGPNRSLTIGPLRLGGLGTGTMAGQFDS